MKSTTECNDPQLTARCAPGLEKTIGFKGVRGYEGVRELVRDAMLPETTVAKVHMGVFSTCLGRRLQTSPGCYLENKIAKEMPWLDVGGRTMDQCNIVRLVVVGWGDVGLPRPLWPVSNDLVVTCKGSVMHRFTWNGAGCGLEWTQESEQAVLSACQWVADAISAAC